MGNNGNGNGAEPKIPIKCECGQVFSAKLPQAEIANMLTSSSVVAAHPNPIKCLCGRQFVIGIDGAQLSWVAKPLPNQSRIVVPDLVPKLKLM